MVQYMEIHQRNPLCKKSWGKKNSIISLDAEKSFAKIQQPFEIKFLERSRSQGLYLNIVKAIYSKPVSNIKINGEKLDAIPLISDKTRPLSSYLFTVVYNIVEFYSTRSYIHSNYITKRGQRDTNWKGRIQNITICRWYDNILIWPPNFHQGTPRLDIQQSSWI